ncbi:hypothetical protein [Oligoflexus tunisiensis]|uniref:hypothetical protein n=1 Tax=Oligoflexus tunisiensis TaxID=708132 RepID=UPI00114CB961|nr:hypothetical protein [Oligoflexus tunisiensis]
MNFKILLTLLLASHTALAMGSRESEQLLGLPERPGNALTGTQFIQKIKHVPQYLREKMIIKEVLTGNIPEFQRTLVPVESTITSGPYQGQKLRYWVLPDYLSIGTNDDFVRVPLNLYSIRILARKLNLSIPTTDMVDDIYTQAQLKLKPTALPSGRAMTTVQYFQMHNRLVQNQIEESGGTPGMLVAGHKKDVVQSLRLLAKPQAIAIYGWHMDRNQPIQPLSTIHGAEYADYSHGVRFVSNIVEVNGHVMDLRAVLDQKLSETLASRPARKKPRS